jgi:hypothetical protein
MKNFFRLEVFKDDQLVFDKQCPTLLITNIVRQWTGPDLDYKLRVTFDSGLVVTSENLNAILGADNLFNLRAKVETDANRP